MGIYIKGIEMPKDESEYWHIFITPYGDVYNCFDGGLTERPIANAIDVSDHGDLIDRDAIKVGLWEEDEYKMLCDAPVVIPAERNDWHSIDPDAEAEYLIDKFAKMWQKAEDSYTGDNRYAVLGVPEERSGA